MHIALSDQVRNTYETSSLVIGNNSPPFLPPSLPPSFLPSLSLPFPSHSRSALHSMLSYIRQAREKLNSLSSTTSREAEATWFMKIAWNLALQCGEHYHEMGQLFSMSHQVCD